VCIAAVVGLSIYVYLRCLGQIIGQDGRYRFRLIDLLIFTTAVVMLCGVGAIGDAAVLCLFVIYTIGAGPMWRKVIEYRVRFKPTVMCLTSAAIVSSFVAMLTVAAALVCVFGPWTDSNMPWTSILFPRSAFLTLYPSVMFAWVCILGDNYQGENDLVIYGLPVGLPLNIAIGIVAGAVLGLTADSLRTSEPGDVT
jgi:hypothetical protein